MSEASGSKMDKNQRDEALLNKMSAFCFPFIIVCPAGHLLHPMKNDLCEECPVGSWNNRTDQAGCIICPGMGSTPGNGTVSQDQCSESLLESSTRK